MKMVMILLVVVFAVCANGCSRDSSTLAEESAPYWTSSPTNLSRAAYSIAIDLTGCFLANEVFLPPVSTQAVPAHVYETCQLGTENGDRWTVLIDHGGEQYWVIESTRSLPDGVIHGPSPWPVNMKANQARVSASRQGRMTDVFRGQTVPVPFRQGVRPLVGG